MKKIGIVLLLFIIFIVGCGTRSIQNQPDQINASYVPLPLNVPSIIAKQQNLFEKEFAKDNIKFKYYNLVAGPQMTEALAAGSLDFASVIGGTSAIMARAQGVDLKIIADYSMSPKGFAIVVGKESKIKTIADLKGAKVATAKGTIAHQLLAEALHKAKLTEQDIQFINMPLADAAVAVQSGQVEAAVVAEPILQKALSSGKVRILQDGQGLINAQIVVAVRSDFAKKYPDLVKRYLKVQAESIKIMNEDKAAAINMTAQENNMSPETIKKILPEYNFSMALDQNAIDELKNTTEFLKQSGLIKSNINTDNLIKNMVDTRFVQSL